jgi:hypothetical protein
MQKAAFISNGEKQIFISTIDCSAFRLSSDFYFYLSKNLQKSIWVFDTGVYILAFFPPLEGGGKKEALFGVWGRK